VTSPRTSGKHAASSPPEERANDAFVRLVAGQSERGEPLFANAASFFDSRQGLGDSLRHALRGVPAPAAPAGAAAFDPAAIAQELRHGALDAMGASRHPRSSVAQPLWEHGLVPSSDGLRWCEPACTTTRDGPAYRGERRPMP
jgi:FAD-dependent halogenase